MGGFGISVFRRENRDLAGSGPPGWKERTLWALLAVSMVGCSRDPAPPVDPPARPSESAKAPGADEDPALALSARMTDIAERDRGDCPRMGADLKRFLDENASSVRAVKDAERARSPADRAAYSAKHRARIEALGRRLLPALEPCATDAAVIDAMKALPSPPKEPVVSDHPLP